MRTVVAVLGGDDPTAVWVFDGPVVWDNMADPAAFHLDGYGTESATQTAPNEIQVVYSDVTQTNARWALTEQPLGLSTPVVVPETGFLEGPAGANVQVTNQSFPDAAPGGSLMFNGAHADQVPVPEDLEFTDDSGVIPIAGLSWSDNSTLDVTFMRNINAGSGHATWAILNIDGFLWLGGGHLVAPLSGDGTP